MSEPIHIISLGAGVQSSTMALMAAAGEITPMPKCAIFADTQDEPKSVYAWLDWLEKHLPFPIHRVTAGRLSEQAVHIHTRKKDGVKYAKIHVPVFTYMPDGKIGINRRQCTRDFKIRPIQKRVREVAADEIASWRKGEWAEGFSRDVRFPAVIQWIGISRDEIYRVKPSGVPYIKNIWPLIGHGFSRKDCLDWMEEKGWPKPPRSACVYCPFHNDAEWSRLKTQEPEAFQAAVKFESNLHSALETDEVWKGTAYLHKSAKPIGEVDFNKASKDDRQINLFNNECEGMCGV